MLNPFQQLLSLTLQIVATLALNPVYHAILIQTEMIDSLMQLILPSDEWYYTNHSTKYAKYVKHQAARILVYLGLDKRLRNKVYLFDLLGKKKLYSYLFFPNLTQLQKKNGLNILLLLTRKKIIIS